MSVELLQKVIKSTSRSSEKLVLVVGKAGSGKSRLLRELPADAYIDLSKELSERLLHLPRRKRPQLIQNLLQEIINSCEGSLVIVDNIEMLFLPELELNPLKILAQLSREKILVVAWSGSYKDGQLVWGEPGQLNYHILTFPEVYPGGETEEKNITFLVLNSEKGNFSREPAL